MTTEIINKLTANIQSNPSNLSACFRQTSRQTGVSEASLKNVYYKSLRKTNTFFVTHTTQGIQINVKNSKAIKELKNKLVLEKKLLSLSELDTASKVQFFDLIMGL